MTKRFMISMSVIALLSLGMWLGSVVSVAGYIHNQCEQVGTSDTNKWYECE